MKFITLWMTALLIGSSAYAQNEQSSIAIEINSELSEAKENTFLYHNFGRVLVGSLHVIRYDVTNTGETPLRFVRATISGADFDGYHSCTAGLEPKQKCWFEIRYWPMFEGWDVGRFVLSFDQQNNIVVDLRGDAFRF